MARLHCYIWPFLLALIWYQWRVSARIGVKKLGCFRDKKLEDRPLPELLFSDRKNYNKNNFKRPYVDGLVHRCAAKATAIGYTVFGIENYADCYSGDGGELTYKRDGPAKDCYKPDREQCVDSDDEPCVGDDDSIYVYKPGPPATKPIYPTPRTPVWTPSGTTPTKATPPTTKTATKATRRPSKPASSASCNVKCQTSCVPTCPLVCCTPAPPVYPTYVYPVPSPSQSGLAGQCPVPCSPVCAPKCASTCCNSSLPAKPFIVGNLQAAQRTKRSIKPKSKTRKLVFLLLKKNWRQHQNPITIPQ